MKILIAEDDATSALLLTKTLESDGYDVVSTGDGVQALAALRTQEFDAVLTDWMMPHMDGISLVRRVRAEFENPPPVLVITALNQGDARSHALDAGADDYLAKPYQPREILRRLSDCIRRANQPMPAAAASTPARVVGPRRLPSHVAVGVASSTGGPEALREFVSSLDPDARTAYLLVQHGPEWMLETFTQRLQGLTDVDVVLATDGATVEPGKMYVCPGDRHMVVTGPTPTIRLNDDPPENFVRPAADPLFRSLASVYGRRAVGVVLTGMGRDGSLGAQQLHAAGGRVVAQDPMTAVVASMPRSAIGLGIVDEIVALKDMADVIRTNVNVAARAPRAVGA